MMPEELFSRSARMMQPSPIRRMAGLVNQPGVISFAGGMPNPATFPDKDLRRILDEIVERDGSRIFQYGVTRGLQEFCELLAGLMAERGIDLARGQGLMVTNGSQQGLNLVSQVFLDPGDVVLVESPSYVGALACFRNHQAELVGVGQDGAGIIPEQLDERAKALAAAGKRVKFLYCIPNFQNPSGVTITPARRGRIVEIARRHGFLIVEDDPYGELYFSGVKPEDVRPVKSCPGGEDVVYLSSFSKVVTPGLRTAFLAAPEWIIARLELAKQAADLCSSSLDQRLIYEYCRRGLFAAHLQEVRDFYEVKCRAMLRAMDEFMPKGITWTRPMGGMFLWGTLPGGMDAEALAMEAVQRLKVAFIHGAPFFVDGTGRNTFRLTFAKEDVPAIERGVAILGDFFGTRLE
jgi:2-aminoadipate transaminase